MSTRTRKTNHYWWKILSMTVAAGVLGLLAAFVLVNTNVPTPESMGVFEHLWSLPLNPYGLLMQICSYGSAALGFAISVFLSSIGLL